MDCNNFMYRAFDEFELQGKYYKVSVTEGHEQAQTGRDEQGKCRQEKAEVGSTDWTHKSSAQMIVGKTREISEFVVDGTEAGNGEL